MFTFERSNVQPVRVNDETGSIPAFMRWSNDAVRTITILATIVLQPICTVNPKHICARTSCGYIGMSCVVLDAYTSAIRRAVLVFETHTSHGAKSPKVKQRS